MHSENKEKILRICEFMEEEIGHLKKVMLSFEEYRKNDVARRDIERCVENVVNAGLDIAKIFVAEGKGRIPDTYRGYFLVLSEMGIIDEKLAIELGKGVKLRNVLSHEYLDIKWANLEWFIKEGYKPYEALIGIVREKIKKEE